MLTIPIVRRMTVILCNGQRSCFAAPARRSGNGRWAWGYADLEADLHVYKQPNRLQICKKAALQMVIRIVKADLEGSRFE